MPQGTKQPRRPGAPKGNQNALKHGRRSAAAIEKRRSRNAMLKASALVLNQLGMLDGRCRCKPLRQDQIRYVPAEWLPLISPWYVCVETIKSMTRILSANNDHPTRLANQ